LPHRKDNHYQHSIWEARTATYTIKCTSTYHKATFGRTYEKNTGRNTADRHNRTITGNRHQTSLRRPDETRELILAVERKHVVAPYRREVTQIGRGATISCGCHSPPTCSLSDTVGVRRQSGLEFLRCGLTDEYIRHGALPSLLLQIGLNGRSILQGINPVVVAVPVSSGRQVQRGDRTNSTISVGTEGNLVLNSAFALLQYGQVVFEKITMVLFSTADCHGVIS
jgi:hypothetical protein